MAVVTISRQFGAGGRTLGVNIAKKLGYQFIERQIIQNVAKEANVSVDWVESMEKEAGDWLLNMVSKMVSSRFIERLLADSASDFDEEKYLKFLQKVITELARSGDVVIVGQGAQFILDKNPEVIKVLLVASMSDRVEFMEKNYQLNKSRAEHLVSKECGRRAAFLARLDPRDPNDPSLYHVCLNTSQISLGNVEKMVIDLVSAQNGA